ncbi:FAD dependent oxidoreductase-domain-containing protein [Verticillium dahliae]|nr:FAD dependent oxidoreductase-domain-containing protein [Verticillium dahliae]
MTGATLRDGQADLPSERSTASYWHREPSEKLLGHRTTAELPATADVVIIGSGITGAFAAHFLKEANAASDVLMLEAREACWVPQAENLQVNAPRQNGGHCQPSVYGLSTAVARFELNTYAFLRDLVAEHDVPCDWVLLSRAHPDLAAKARVVRSAAELAALGSTAPRRRRAGTTCEPVAVQLVCWVLERLLAQGAGSTCRRARRRRTYRARGPDDNDVAAARPRSGVVHTPRGQVAARKVLLACNGHTSRLVPAFSDLLVPVRGGRGPHAGPGQRALEHSYVFMDARATTGIAEGTCATYLRVDGIMGYSRDFLPWLGAEALGGATGLWVAAGYTGMGCRGRRCVQRLWA